MEEDNVETHKNTRSCIENKCIDETKFQHIIITNDLYTET